MKVSKKNDEALYGAFLGTEEQFCNQMDAPNVLGALRGTLRDALKRKTGRKRQMLATDEEPDERTEQPRKR